MRAGLVIALTLGSICTALDCRADAVTTAAPPSVYKCRQANGVLLYQDYACKDGVVVDIKPDAADPAAIRRLERAQAEYQRDAAQRRALEESEEVRRAALERMRSEADASQAYAQQPDALYLPAYPYYVPRARPRVQPHASRATREEHRDLHERRVPVIVRRPHAG